jgi:hypothetical protein
VFIEKKEISQILIRKAPVAMVTVQRGQQEKQTKHKRGRTSNSVNMLVKIAARVVNELRPFAFQTRHCPSHPQPLNILQPVLPHPVNLLRRLHAEIPCIEIPAEH